MKEWYTQQEAAELLNVSKATIYHYSKQGKIRKIPDPRRYHREARYYKEEIDQMVMEREQQPKGLSPSDVANKLGLSVQSVYKYIQEGTINALEVPYGDERFHYVITNEDFEKAKAILKPTGVSRIRRAEYYDSAHDIGLFQLFHTQMNLHARVMKNDKHQWGFFLQNYQKWVELEEGIQRYGLKPAYSIHQSNLESKGHVYLRVPKDEDILYPFIDYLYKTWGIENAGIRDRANAVFISIKAGARPLPQSFSFEQLIPFIQEGTIDSDGALLVLESGYRKTSVELPVEMLNTIRQLAEQENQTMSEWIEKALDKELNTPSIE